MYHYIIICLLSISFVTTFAQSEVDVIQVGALVPITGDASRHGQDIRATLNLAESEINQYLQKEEAAWRLDILVEDSATSPVIALDKLAAIKSHGIDLVIGTYSSAELRNVMGYATSNDMMLIAYASTAPSLGIANDKIFRFIPDATNQAPANAKLFESMGITHVIPVWRGDAWGDDLVKATKDRFELLGGAFHEGIRYNPEAIEFSAEAALLANQVKNLAEKVGHENIGILLLTFSEGVNIAQSVYRYEEFVGLQWVGSDTLLNVGGPGSDRISSEFFDSQLSVTVFAPPENPTYEKVAAHVLEENGREPIIYSLTAYEAAWAMALSIHAANSTDSDLVAAVLPDILEERDGIFGKIILNEAGDLDADTYEIQQLINNNWVHSGFYNVESDDVVWIQDVEISDVKEEIDLQSDGGCLIATATYQSELAPQVQFLREVRNDILQSHVGVLFMKGFSTFYYSFSPTIADYERQSPELRWIIKTIMTPALYILGIMSVAEPDSEASILLLGSTTILLLVGVYVVAPIYTIHRIKKHAHK